MKITKQILYFGSTQRLNIVLTKRSCEAIGLKYPLIKGWVDKIIGKDITEEQYDLFIKGKNEPKKELKRIRLEEIKKKEELLDNQCMFNFN